jgi:hypothetical protein
MLLAIKMAEVIDCASAFVMITLSILNSVNKAVGVSYHYPVHVGYHEVLGGVACVAAVAH